MAKEDSATNAKKRKPGRPSGSPATAEADFLDAAERHFADHGFAGAKVRAIAEDAQANLGALHYYWGSKGALFRAVCMRRLQPVVEKRLELLDRCLIEAKGDKPQIEDILAAYLVPAFLQDREDEDRRELFRRVLLRTLTDPSPEVKAIMSDIFDEGAFRFVRMLRSACPHLDDQTFYWRLHGVLGVFQYATSNSERVLRLSHGRFDPNDLDEGIRGLVRFLSAGLRAPQSGEEEEAAKGSSLVSIGPKRASRFSDKSDTRTKR